MQGQRIGSPFSLSMILEVFLEVTLIGDDLHVAGKESRDGEITLMLQ